MGSNSYTQEEADTERKTPWRPMTQPQTPGPLERAYDGRNGDGLLSLAYPSVHREFHRIWRHLDTLSPPVKQDERVTIAIDRDAAQSAYDRCKLWPEQTLEGRVALLELRKLVEKALSDDQ